MIHGVCDTTIYYRYRGSTVVNPRIGITTGPTAVITVDINDLSYRCIGEYSNDYLLMLSFPISMDIYFYQDDMVQSVKYSYIYHILSFINHRFYLTSPALVYTFSDRTDTPSITSHQTVDTIDKIVREMAEYAEEVEIFLNDEWKLRKSLSGYYKLGHNRDDYIELFSALFDEYDRTYMAGNTFAPFVLNPAEYARHRQFENEDEMEDAISDYDAIMASSDVDRTSMYPDMKTVIDNAAPEVFNRMFKTDEEIELGETEEGYEHSEEETEEGEDNSRIDTDEVSEDKEETMAEDNEE